MMARSIMLLSSKFVICFPIPTLTRGSMISRVFLLCVACFASMGQGTVDLLYSDCDIETYYQEFTSIPLASWDRTQLTELLYQTHRNSLPYTSSSPDVWDALIDLDGTLDEDNNALVELVYCNTSVPALPYGTSDTWNREHLWPKSRGVGTSGMDYTDVHALRPSDWNVNSARNNLFFGDCGDQCTDRPAADEAAPDSAKNSDMFLPPVNVRGNIARALFYMELRYALSEETNVENLILTDCPDETATNLRQMAYLSDLLRWHEQDPVDDAETRRNARVCTHWQGNRNIFVDYPDLVPFLFGEPSERPYDCTAQQTSQPTDPGATSPPTSESGEPMSSPQSCSQLSPGDVQILGLTSDNPDSFTLVALEALPANLELLVTDNGWTGSSFTTNEGILKLTVPSSGISKGAVFGYEDSLSSSSSSSSLYLAGNWEDDGGTFALATAGDSVIVYCYDNDNSIVALGGILVGSSWQTASEEESLVLSTSESALPPGLAFNGGGAIELSSTNADNVVYTGVTTGSKEDLLLALSEESNWSGSNSERLGYEGVDSFVILGGDSEDNTTACTTGVQDCSSGSSSWRFTTTTFGWVVVPIITALYL